MRCVVVCLAVLPWICCIVGASTTEPLRALVGVYDAETPPFYAPGVNGNDTGFEAAMRKQLCELANLQCEVVPLPALDDRITGLQNVSAAWFW